MFVWEWGMKAICLRARDGPEALAYDEAQQPRPGEGEVLVRVHAAGVIHTELSWLPTWTNRAGEPRPLPVIPGHEFSGEIAALGAGVRDAGVGDLVYGLNDWYRDGASAEYCVARIADIAHKPTSVDHVHAAATPISALTTWQGLVDRAGRPLARRAGDSHCLGSQSRLRAQPRGRRGDRLPGRAVRGRGPARRRGFRHGRRGDAGEVLERAQARRKAGHRRCFRGTDDRRAHSCRVLHRGA